VYRQRRRHGVIVKGADHWLVDEAPVTHAPLLTTGPHLRADEVVAGQPSQQQALGEPQPHRAAIPDFRALRI
jgi:hypothetical protein